MKKQLHNNPARAFTLIEILVVIAIIGILAGMIVATMGSVMNKGKIHRTQTELALLTTAIESYKAKKGFYPPDNLTATSTNYQTNALYYELAGTRLVGTKYTTLDGRDTIDTSLVNLNLNLGVPGFANSETTAQSDEAAGAETFLKNLTPRQAQTNKANLNPSGVIKLLIAPVNDQNLEDFNPWYYNASNPKHNADSYDLWAVVRLGGKTNVIGNWSDSPIVGTNLYP